MLKSPLVSIIIPIYNRPVNLTRAVNSVIEQTYSNWECIIVDDRSSDNTYEIACQLVLEDNRLKVLKNDRKIKNASVCRNIGLNYSQGEYIIFLDSDDYLLDHCLSSRINFVRNNIAKNFYVFANGYFENYPGDLERVRFVKKNQEFNFSQFLSGHYIWGIQNVMWNRQTLYKLNGFDEQFERLQDVEIHIRALSNFKDSYATSQVVDSLINISISRNNYKGEEFVLKVVRSYKKLFLSINSKTLQDPNFKYSIGIIKKFTTDLSVVDTDILKKVRNEVNDVYNSFKIRYRPKIRINLIQLVYKYYIRFYNFYGKRLIFKLIIRKLI